MSTFWISDIHWDGSWLGHASNLFLLGCIARAGDHPSLDPKNCNIYQLKAYCKSITSNVWIIFAEQMERVRPDKKHSQPIVAVEAHIHVLTICNSLSIYSRLSINNCCLVLSKYIHLFQDFVAIITSYQNIIVLDVVTILAKYWITSW